MNAMQPRHVFIRALLLAALPTLMILPATAENKALDMSKPQHMLFQAAECYNTNRFVEATAIYETLIQQGYRDEALFYNMGNACFKQNKIAWAILNYRRAWYLAPRDPDIAANLKLAFDSTPAEPPKAVSAAVLLQKLSAREWALLTGLSWWLGAAAICLHLVLRRRFDWLWKTAIGLFVLAGVSLLGLHHWHGFKLKPEAVVIQNNIKALYAPLADATEHFNLPPGSVVRVLDVSHNGAWLHVLSGKQKGWIPKQTCQYILTDRQQTPFQS